jgi:hypothetical protein
MSRLRVIAPLAVAAVLAGIAVVTVQGAGCDDPGRYVPVAGGYELIGGCVAPGDIVVPEPAPHQVESVDPTAPSKG